MSTVDEQTVAEQAQEFSGGTPVSDRAAVALPTGEFPDISTEYSFDDLINGTTYSIPGYSLIPDKEELVGVPHIITRITFNQPMKVNKAGDMRDYVSIEARIFPAEQLERAVQRGWVPDKTELRQLKVDPLENVVYNDGSTGIRNQCVEMLDMAGFIEVGHQDLGKERFSLPWTEWVSFSQERTYGDIVVPSFNRGHDGTQFRTIVARGLRVSRYANEFTDEGVTFYLG